MSLTTDALALGAAFAITLGSAVQARQAYTELNEKIPAGKSFAPLLLTAKLIWFIAKVSIKGGVMSNFPLDLTWAKVRRSRLVRGCGLRVSVFVS
jgi:hypothetical protein